MALHALYTPTARSAEEGIGNFSSILNNVKAQCKANEMYHNYDHGRPECQRRIGMRRWNSWQLRVKNKRGERWVKWCTANDQIITKTWSSKTLMDMEKSERRHSELDRLHNKRFWNGWFICKTYSNADCESDHLRDTCNHRIKNMEIKECENNA